MSFRTAVPAVASRRARRRAHEGEVFGRPAGIQRRETAHTSEDGGDASAWGSADPMESPQGVVLYRLGVSPGGAAPRPAIQVAYNGGPCSHPGSGTGAVLKFVCSARVRTLTLESESGCDRREIEKRLMSLVGLGRWLARTNFVRSEAGPNLGAHGPDLTSSLRASGATDEGSSPVPVRAGPRTQAGRSNESRGVETRASG